MTYLLWDEITKSTNFTYWFYLNYSCHGNGD